MRTLHLHNVRDEVVERLERLAALDSLSVGELAIRGLTEASTRVDNVVRSERYPTSVSTGP